MINSSTQLKDKVKNLSHGNSDIAQNLIRNFIMERFLERISRSVYKDKIILKGGMLVASLVGLNKRATMDIDTTFQALPLTMDDAKKIIEEIINIHIEDNIKFSIGKISNIMTDFEYPGLRIMLNAQLDKLRQVIKIDISTDDVITPAAINYKYQLFLEERTIEIMSYTPETILAEKIQTIINRGSTTTRMRDFYDIYTFVTNDSINPNLSILRYALKRTCQKRETDLSKEIVFNVLKQISSDSVLASLWNGYIKTNQYVNNLPWEKVISIVVEYIQTVTSDLE